MTRNRHCIITMTRSMTELYTMNTQYLDRESKSNVLKVSHCHSNNPMWLARTLAGSISTLASCGEGCGGNPQGGAGNALSLWLCILMRLSPRCAFIHRHVDVMLACFQFESYLVHNSNSTPSTALICANNNRTGSRWRLQKTRSQTLDPDHCKVAWLEP
jgi:hypothetical protein